MKAIETRYASETSRTTEKIVHFALTSLKRTPSEATQGIYNKLNNINEYAEMGVKRARRKLPRFSSPPARVPKIPITFHSILQSSLDKPEFFITDENRRVIMLFSVGRSGVVSRYLLKYSLCITVCEILLLGPSPLATLTDTLPSSA